jgi:hypothetical protein
MCIVIFSWIAAALIASPVLSADTPSYSNGAFEDLLTDSAEFFQDGEELVDSDQLKKLIITMADMHDILSQSKLTGSAAEARGAKESFYKAVANYVDYLDKHRLTPKAIRTIREWLAQSLHLSGGFEKLGDSFDDTLAMRSWRAMQEASLARDLYGPRHVLLAFLFAQPQMTLPVLSCLIPELDRSRAKGLSDAELESQLHDLGINELFGDNIRNSTLWQSLVQECASVCEGHRRFTLLGEIDDVVDVLLIHSNHPVLFEQAIEEIEHTSTAIIDGFPGYAMADRLRVMYLLREAWNIVHASGNKKALEEFRGYLMSLHKLYREHSDQVTAEWLEQVMKAPDKAMNKDAAIARLKKLSRQGVEGSPSTLAESVIQAARARRVQMRKGLEEAKTEKETTDTTLDEGQREP